jgi:uncharacterized membrane protein
MRTATIAGVLTALAGAQAQITFAPLDPPAGYSNSIALSISADGRTVVGGTLWESGQAAWRWTSASGTQVIPPLPGANISTAAAVSADGSVVVGSSHDGGHSAFRWTGLGGVQQLPGASPGTLSGASAVSADGTMIAGFSEFQAEPRAVRWTPVGIEQIGLLPGHERSFGDTISADGRTVAGNSMLVSPSSVTSHAFVWTEQGGMSALPLLHGASQSIATAMSADGSTVAGYSNPGDRPHSIPFVWTSSTGTLPVPMGIHTDVLVDALSADGSVMVGGGVDASHNGHALLWTAAGGLQDLQSLLESAGLNLAGWSLQRATGVSADGTVIVGVGMYDGERRSWIVSIPAPSAALLSLGIFGVARRRRS